MASVSCSRVWTTRCSQYRLIGLLATVPTRAGRPGGEERSGRHVPRGVQGIQRDEDRVLRELLLPSVGECRSDRLAPPGVPQGRHLSLTDVSNLGRLDIECAQGENVGPHVLLSAARVNKRCKIGDLSDRQLALGISLHHKKLSWSYFLTVSTQ